MPNYKLSQNYVGDLINTAEKILGRRLTQMTVEFPLTHAEIQSAILPAKYRDAVLDMKNYGVAFHESGVVCCTITHPRIPRSALIRLQSRRSFVGSSGYSRLDLDVSSLPDTRQDQLVAWANNAVQELRVSVLAKRTITEFLETHAGSSAQLVARWPALVMLSDKVSEELSSWYVSAAQKEIRRGWRDKFRNVPKSLKPYKWAPENEWPRRNKRAMELTEMILTSATMLPGDWKPTSEITATIESWVKLPGDRDDPPSAR